MPTPPSNRIDHVFTGTDKPTEELLNTIILSLDDHYPDSAIGVVSRQRDAMIVSIEGRRFLLSVTEL